MQTFKLFQYPLLLDYSLFKHDLVLLLEKGDFGKVNFGRANFGKVDFAKVMGRVSKF